MWLRGNENPSLSLNDVQAYRIKKDIAEQNILYSKVFIHASSVTLSCYLFLALPAVVLTKIQKIGKARFDWCKQSEKKVFPGHACVVITPVSVS